MKFTAGDPRVTATTRSLGGMTAAARMTPEERTARARKAALAGVAKRAAAQREKKGLLRAKQRAAWDATFADLAARTGA